MLFQTLQKIQKNLPGNKKKSPKNILMFFSDRKICLLKLFCHFLSNMKKNVEKEHDVTKKNS